MTLEELTWIGIGAEKIDQAYRYKRMSPDVQELADKMKKRYGRF